MSPAILTSEWLETHTSNDTVKDEEERVPLQRKLGNEILTASLIIQENEDGTSTSSDLSKKKEITWSEETYLANVTLQKLGARSASWMLERKASVGPCYRQGMPFGAPSGITVCLPKKPLRRASCVLDKGNPIKSGISVIISKASALVLMRMSGVDQWKFISNKMLAHLMPISWPKSQTRRVFLQNPKTGSGIDGLNTPCDSKLKLFGPVQFEMRRARVSSMRQETKNNNKTIKEENYGQYYSTLRGKLDNFYGRIKHALHI